ncbi:PSD1 and planctomycete cytochrome C domain-containing protein [Novipirellula sp. SH528]|uniref:PSD1 and planctomycete cytochrome C domain-containing protein n=1 Tax=Novipirellula sp. SH528 TaxID=3454466 RepID=UPI003FA168A8
MSFCVYVFAANTVLYADELTDGEQLFALKVQPLLAAKCAACHGDDPTDLGGDFDIRTRESMLKGGESFAEDVVVSGEGEASLLYRVVAHAEQGFEMPPKLADRLSEEQTWWIRDWINAGAPWPSDDQIARIQKQHADGERVLTSKALSEDWQNRRYESEKLWAYRPLKVAEVPKDEHPVDWFINRKLAAAELPSAGDAPATAMVRRMSFGLTGLPPKPQAIREFVAAYERDPQQAVEDFGRKLMASPHYGERFGQHWLDVTRYADSSGYANDYARPNAWRYRDYVVRSFNDDKPFDQFVKEQIAGDEIDPENSEYLIATGFLRMGPWELTGMSVFKEMRQFWLDDVTDSVGQTFLAHAMQCAKCHDHKFDPVPTRDYYGMMAVFSTTQFAERHAPFLRSESQSNFDSANEWVQQKLAYYNADMKELTAKMATLQKVEQGAAKVGDNGLDPGDEASQSRIRKNISRHEIEKDRTLPFAHSVYTGKTIAIKNAKSRWTIPKDRWGKGYFDPDVIYTGGSVYSPGDAVVPGALSAAKVLGEMDVKAFPTGEGKRRLALANWIADPKNPLTARVIVNRVWSWHFGKGIAGNPNNFGGTGGVPSHPEMLGFLAQRFMENGWSIKKLNQLIITSDAYRRSSQHPEPEKLATLDPRNQLYASFLPRRLDAEELRDAMLLVSGELNDALGGIPARPDINPDVAVQPLQIMGNTASAYEPYPLPDQRNRRSLYAERLRGLRDPFLETFNQPGLDDSCERRETSTIAPQALTMLNAEEVHDRSIALAARLVRQGGSDKDILRSAFMLTFGRPATDTETEACLAEWRIATAEEEKLHPKPLEIQTVIERTVMAEKTGEPYTFIEHLPAYESYIPDLQRSDVDARTRGLSHICLVLFNSNEFSYLD